MRFVFFAFQMPCFRSL